jgi:hypothetical protein
VDRGAGRTLAAIYGEAQSVIRKASLAAKDLVEYRHSIMHGWMIPRPIGPLFVRNPTWHREKRRRPTLYAIIDANLLDMAIDSAWTLCQVVFEVRDACADPAKAARLVALERKVDRARSRNCGT